jgi:hypothetical protein
LTGPSIRAQTARKNTSAGEAVSGVTEKTTTNPWHRGRGCRLDLRGGIVPTVDPSFALPGGNAP